MHGAIENCPVHPLAVDVFEEVGRGQRGMRLVEIECNHAQGGLERNIDVLDRFWRLGRRGSFLDWRGRACGRALGNG